MSAAEDLQKGAKPTFARFIPKTRIAQPPAGISHQTFATGKSLKFQEPRRVAKFLIFATASNVRFLRRFQPEAAAVLRDGEESKTKAQY